ncbi:MAG TPA: hypothetical protein DCW90_21040, partial [Lachnospiraceae bacterium]|nr:hypothetical protein [Lachnospiraceae bacterium]
MLPPIKIKLPDRDKDMNLSHITPIKIRIKEIKNSEINNSYVHPIKIKICDRDKDMSSSYEKRQAKVREQNGNIVVKNKEDILATDQVLEYLSNDYVKPIRIKLSTLDLVYNWLYDLLFRFNFASIIRAGYAIVLMFGKFLSKLIHKASVYIPLTKVFGKPRSYLKLKHSIEVALDIFKVEGLANSIKFKQETKVFSQFTEKSLPPIKLLVKVPEITETIIYTRVPRTIEDMLGIVEEPTSDKLGAFILGQSRLATQSGHTIEDEFLNNRTVFDIMYKQVEVKQGVSINDTNFPDANFRSYILTTFDVSNSTITTPAGSKINFTADKAGDGYLTQAELNRITHINCE